MSTVAVSIEVTDVDYSTQSTQLSTALLAFGRILHQAVEGAGPEFALLQHQARGLEIKSKRELDPETGLGSGTVTATLKGLPDDSTEIGATGLALMLATIGGRKGEVAVHDDWTVAMALVIDIDVSAAAGA